MISMATTRQLWVNGGVFRYAGLLLIRANVSISEIFFFFFFLSPEVVDRSDKCSDTDLGDM